MILMRLNKDQINEESFFIHNYLISRHLKGKEWIYGQSLMIFIQFVLINHQNLDEEVLSKFLKKKGNPKLNPFLINQYILSRDLLNLITGNWKEFKFSEPSKFRFYFSNLKSYIAYIKLNIKFYFLDLNANFTSRVLTTAPNKQSDSNEIDINFSEIIYRVFEMLFLNFDRLEKLRFVLPSFRIYSGKFMYNPIILKSIQRRYDLKKEIYALQHGGHNYVSSVYNAFLYPEYYLSKTVITGGSTPPEINFSNSEKNQIQLFRKNNTYSKSENNIEKSFQNKIIFVAGQVLSETFRVDGNPTSLDWLKWNTEVYNFLSKLEVLKLFLKEYPNQNIWKSSRFFIGEINELDKEYKNGSIFICDHFGTTFLKALKNGCLSILLINYDYFNVRDEIKVLIEKFVVIPGVDSELKIQQVINSWDKGNLEVDRQQILDKLYSYNLF